ncbi:hypothetical protein MG7_04612 [Candida albicans P34048]|nr:hypothetical protein MG7_04612 [Candida albicans P34048]KGU25682.1 hypothetical protein MGK_04617 [Candida albicans P57055]
MTTELYGGAITISKLPNSFIDISQIRQVPDTQEVFINQLSSHNDSHDVSGSFDHSFIIDLLQRVDPIDYQEAIHLHLQDIVPPHVHNQPIEQIKQQQEEEEEDNEDDDNDDDGIIRYFSFVQFKPQYKKFDPNESPKQIITLICLIRLEKVDTDVLLQYIIPLKSENENVNVNFEGSTKVDKIVKESYDLFKKIALSFTVKDWNLFG